MARKQRKTVQHQLGHACKICKRTDVTYSPNSIYCKECNAKKNTEYAKKRWREDPEWRLRQLELSKLRAERTRFDLCNCGKRKSKKSAQCIQCNRAPSPNCEVCNVERNDFFEGSLCHGCHLDRINNRRNQPEIKAKIRNAYRRQTLLDNYGITPEDYNNILEAQNNVCAICKGNDWGHNGAKIDHDHTKIGTGCVRGILCGKCNWAIGQLGDNAAGVKRALVYLERYEASTGTNTT